MIDSSLIDWVLVLILRILTTISMINIAVNGKDFAWAYDSKIKYLTQTLAHNANIINMYEYVLSVKS